MLTLTLRSPRDGRFLARVVEQTGNVFVLDFGDRRVIDDATQRIHRGFTVFRQGQLARASPRDRDLILMLADYYVGEGLLVSLEEPLWPGRERSLEDELAARTDERSLTDVTEHLRFLGDLDDETQDLPTDVWGRDEADKVNELVGGVRDRAVRTTWSPTPLQSLPPVVPSDALEDAPTQEISRERSPSGLELDGPPTLLDVEDDATEVVARPRRTVGDDSEDDQG